jgi:hypothetical protein
LHSIPFALLVWTRTRFGGLLSVPGYYLHSSSKMADTKTFIRSCRRLIFRKKYKS